VVEISEDADFDEVERLCQLPYGADLSPSRSFAEESTTPPTSDGEEEECVWCPGSPTGQQGSDLISAKLNRQIGNKLYNNQPTYQPLCPGSPLLLSKRDSPLKPQEGRKGLSSLHQAGGGQDGPRLPRLSPMKKRSVSPLKSPHKVALERQETVALQECLKQCDELHQQAQDEKVKVAALESDKASLKEELQQAQTSLTRAQKRIRVMCHVSSTRQARIDASVDTSLEQHSFVQGGGYNALPLASAWRSHLRCSKEREMLALISHWRAESARDAIICPPFGASGEEDGLYVQLEDERELSRRLETSLAEAVNAQTRVLSEHEQALREMVALQEDSIKNTRESTSGILCLAACLTETRRDSQVAALVKQCEKIESEALPIITVPFAMHSFLDLSPIPDPDPDPDPNSRLRKTPLNKAISSVNSKETSALFKLLRA